MGKGKSFHRAASKTRTVRAAPKARMLFYVAAIALLTAAGSPAGAQETSTLRFLFRGSVGYDLIADNLAFGAGAGYYLPLLGTWTEVMADLFAGFYATSFYRTATMKVDETGGLAIIAAHYDYMIGYRPGGTGLYGLIGAGFFAGGSWWNEIDTYTPTMTTTPYNGGGSTFGTILDLGIGFALSATLDARVDVPVLVHFSGALSIPVVAGVIYRF